MKFTTDEASTTGLDHQARGETCQDYALSGVVEDELRNGAYAVVSDGCSSGKRTDIGARLVCLEARAQVMFNQCESESLWHRLNVVLNQRIEQLGLERDDLLATCVAVRVTETDTEIACIGDGLAVAELTTGKLLAIRFEWSNNTPIYAIYGKAEMGQLTSEDSRLVVEVGMLGGGEQLTKNCATYPAAGFYVGSTFTFPTNSIRRVAIFSDGATQVRNHIGAEKPWQEVVTELMAFKGTAGKFAKRRLSGFLRSLKDYRPEDDLTYAVINIEHEASDGKPNG